MSTSDVKEPAPAERTADAPASADGEAPAVPPREPPPAGPPAARRNLPAWGDALARFEKKWVTVETKLAVGVLLCEILALCAWIFLKGLSTPPTSSKAGVAFRAILTATALGTAAWFALRKQPHRFRSTATTISVAAGLFLGRAWATVGVEYSSEILNWYQDASSLTLIGGLRGVGTRLTAWLAMLGASLATSSGKHINIDVVMRFVPVRTRVPMAVAAWLAASIVCFGATWGFVDHIAIASFGAPRDGTAGAKLHALQHEAREHAFILRKQIGIDFGVGFKVFGGEKYSAALTGAEWNQKIRDGGYEAFYTPEQVKSLYVPPDMDAKPVSPLVVVPGKTQRGLLVDDLNLLFPFGFLMIALKFLVRAALAISGHVVVDPDAMHREDDVEDAQAHHHAEEGGA